MRRQFKGRSEAFVRSNDGEQGFWPSYADMMSAVALILFFVMLLSYIQNLITGNNLQNTKAALADTEGQLLDGPSGLQSFSATLNLVAASFRHLQLISSLAKRAVLDMRGAVYRTPEEDEAVGLKGRVLIEYTEMDQSGPDLFEASVGLYRRMYTVRLDYQTVEVFEDEEVLSG